MYITTPSIDAKDHAGDLQGIAPYGLFGKRTSISQLSCCKRHSEPLKSQLFHMPERQTSYVTLCSAEITPDSTGSLSDWKDMLRDGYSLIWANHTPHPGPKAQISFAFMSSPGRIDPQWLLHVFDSMGNSFQRDFSTTRVFEFLFRVVRSEHPQSLL